MLAYLRGKIAKKTGDSVVLDVHGVGYRVGICETLPSEGDEATLYLSEVIREDKYDLYGFLAEDSLHLFEALIGVQGVGPKVGMKIMSAGAPDHIRKTILAGDVAFFGQVPGIGKKTAQKIILELKGILVDGGGVVVQDEVSDALLSLGYTQDHISAVLPHLAEGSSEERLKAALRMLGKKS